MGSSKKRLGSPAPFASLSHRSTCRDWSSTRYEVKRPTSLGQWLGRRQPAMAVEVASVWSAIRTFARNGVLGVVPTQPHAGRLVNLDWLKGAVLGTIWAQTKMASVSH